MFRLAATLVAAAFALVLTGCGSDNGGSGSSPGTTSSSSPAGGAGGDAVAWAEKVCTSFEGQIGALSQAPDLDTSNPQTTKDSMATYLDGLASAIDSVVSGLKDAGAPPVDGGQQIVDDATKGFEEAQKTITDAKTTIEQAPVNDPTAFQAAFTKAGEELQKLSDLDSLESLEKNTELKAAFEEAPTCKKLDEQAGGSPTSSAPTS